MKRDAFDETATLLAGLGYEIVTATYDAQAFGSWYIDIRLRQAAFRVIWDGKDGWVILQRSGPSDGFQDLWIGKHPEEQTPAQVLEQVQAVAR